MIQLFIGVTVVSLAFMAYIVFEPWLANVDRFSTGFRVTCPVQKTEAKVEVHTALAAISSAEGPPALQMRTCSLLKPNATCGEECLIGIAA